MSPTDNIKFISATICTIARPWEALLIGFIGSAFACSGCRLLERRQIDDPVICVPTHTHDLHVISFAEKDDILQNDTNSVVVFKGGSFRFLGIQVFGVSVISCWAIVTSYGLLYVIDKFMRLRVTLLEEIIGADQHEHGIADINDPEGLMQIRKFLRRGAKIIRLVQTRNRMFLKQPRHRAVYSFSDPNTKTRECSVANGNATSQELRDHGYTLRKRFRQSQNQSSPTIKRTRHTHGFDAKKHVNADFVDNSATYMGGSLDGSGVHDRDANQIGQQQDETLSISQICTLMGPVARSLPKREVQVRHLRKSLDHIQV